MSPQLPYVPTGLHDLRWVALSEAAQASGKSERQLQRWAAKDQGLMRRRERGHTVEYCLDDVLAVVGHAPMQQRIAQQHRRIAELERALTEVITPPAKADGFSEAEATDPPTAVTAASRATLAATRYVRARRLDPSRRDWVADDSFTTTLRAQLPDSARHFVLGSPGLTQAPRGSTAFKTSRCVCELNSMSITVVANISTDSIPQITFCRNRKPCPALPLSPKGGQSPRRGEAVHATMEVALTDGQARSRTQRTTLQRIKKRHKLRCTAKEAQIAALSTLVATLQDEIIRLRLTRKS